MATELSGHCWKFNISWTVCLLTFAVSTVKLGHTAAVEPNPVRFELDGNFCWKGCRHPSVARTFL